MYPNDEAAGAAGDERQPGTFFSRVKGTLERIRDAVVRSSQIGKIKLDSTFLRRERDELLRELGAGVYSLARAGTVKLPSSFDAVLERIDRLDQGIADQERELAVVEAEPRATRKAAAFASTEPAEGASEAESRESEGPAEGSPNPGAGTS